MKRIISCTLAIFIVFIAYGQTQTDSVKVYFNLNHASFDPTLGNNASSMDSFIDKVRMVVKSDDLDHIVIHGYASPDGTISINERLAKKRSEAIAAYIISKIGISKEKVRTKSHGVAWDELREIVADNKNIPGHDRIMEILNNKSLRLYSPDGKVVDERNKRLMSLDNGKPYRWMLEHIFPKLRYVHAISIYRKSESCDRSLVLYPENDNTTEPDPANAIIISDKENAFTDIDQDIKKFPPHDTGNELSDKDTPTLSETQSNIINSNIPPCYRMALKTNMLYDAVLMPNLEIEWLFNDRWSVALEGNVAWWGKYSRNKSYRIAVIDSELRRWIKPRAPWHGMFIGLFAGGGWYDLLHGSPGYYGYGIMSGMSLGYMWPIGKRLSLEAGIGAGYLHTRIKEYQPYEGHHLYQRTRSLNYFGPLKLKLSLAWRFWDKNKSKQRNSAI